MFASKDNYTLPTFIHFIIQGIQQDILIDVLHLDEVCVISEDVLLIVLQLLQQNNNGNLIQYVLLSRQKISNEEKARPNISDVG